MKAMRDDKGEMVRNAHLIGFFRRICKLLFLRTKPVFVFDGGTPVLKRRTVAARRRHRGNAQAKIRKTAEKLLLNHLKARRLEELAAEIKNSRAAGDLKGKKVKGDSKGKQVVASGDDAGLDLGVSNEGKSEAERASNQEKLDELLAASLAVEEERKFADNELENAAYGQEGDDNDDDEEMIIPVTSSSIDPTVLSSLPPSMQLDLLVQMRERQMAENRQKYQKIKKVPTKFSELQIQSYLKTVAFRREIDEVQKSAAGRGVGGVQISKISSEANREFIFSSSFTGDKQMLASSGVQAVQQNGNANQHTTKKKSITTTPVKCNPFTSQVKSTENASVGSLVRDFGNDVETYRDERGIFRVSRMRALGMRMTRDLQQNLDLMKEYELEKTMRDICTEIDPSCTKDVSDAQNCSSKENGPTRVSADDERNSEAINRKTDMLKEKGGIYHVNEQSVFGREAAIEISFPEDDDGMKDTDDLFMHLVSESSPSNLLSQNVNSEKNKKASDSECSWEEGHVDKNESGKTDLQETHLVIEADEGSCEEDEIDWEEGAPQVSKDPSHYQVMEACVGICEEDEIDWEEGLVEKNESDKNDLQETHMAMEAGLGSSKDDINWEEEAHQVPKDPSQAGCGKAVSRRSFEEESDIQEAIKRSLEDLKREKPSPIDINAKLKTFEDNQNHSSTLETYRLSGYAPLKHFLDRSPSSGSLQEDADIREATKRSLEDFKGEKSSTMSDGSAKVSLSDEVRKRNSTLENSTANGLMPLASSLERSPSHNATSERLDPLDYVCRKDALEVIDLPEKHLSSSTISMIDHCRKPSLMDETNRRLHVSSINNTMRSDADHFTHTEQQMDLQKHAVEGPTLKIPDDFTKISCNMNLETTGHAVSTILPDAHTEVFEASESSVEKSNKNVNFQKRLLIEERQVSTELEQLQENNESKHTIKVDYFRGKSASHLGDQFDKEAEANLDEEISYLRQERVGLGEEQRKLECNAESVSSEMFAECQELLQMFGLPYIIAPMEAESQCAYMEMKNLVDGVVTDDSDVFFFGSRSVYKNIFDDRKYVETYFMKDIETELGLTREKLILMALLLGSDYTEGISGIGIVNAIEVVHAFPEEDGLQKFREWIESPDPAILRKLDSHTGTKLEKKPSRVSNNDADGAGNDVNKSEKSVLKSNYDQSSIDGTTEIKDMFMNKHRNVSKNWHIPSSFPSDLVISACTSPLVDESMDPFSWGKPDLVLRRRLCWKRFGWNNQEADELLLPVLKEYNKHETQLRLEAFYTFNERFAKIRSQRIKKALKGITGSSSGLLDDHVHESSSAGKKRKLSSSATEEHIPEHNSDGKAGSSRKASKMSRLKSTESRDFCSSDGGGDSLDPSQDGGNTITETTNMKGRGRGRGRGRGAR